jgi:hypothetical protein
MLSAHNSYIYIARKEVKQSTVAMNYVESSSTDRYKLTFVRVVEVVVDAVQQVVSRLVNACWALNFVEGSLNMCKRLGDIHHSYTNNERRQRRERNPRGGACYVPLLGLPPP